MDKNLISLIRGKRHFVVFIEIFMVLDIFCSILLSAFISYTLYDFIYLGEKGNLWLYLLFGIIYIFFKININIVIGRLKTALGNTIQVNLRQKAFDKIVEYNGRIPGFNSTSLSTLCVEGIEQLDKYYSQYIPSLYFAMISPIVFFVLFVILDWKVGLVFGICFPIIPFLIYLVNKQTLKILDGYYSMYLNIGQHFSDALMGVGEIKQYQSQNFIDDSFYVKSNQYRKSTTNAFVLQLLCLSVVDLIAYIGTAICIVLGVMDVQKDLLNSFACIFVIIMALDVFVPLKNLAHAYNVAMNGRAAGAKVLSIIKLPSFDDGKEPFTGEVIEFENINFAYKNHRFILKDINLKIDTPGLYAFVGRSGAGKSTIVNLLTRSVRPLSGTAKLGGKNIFSIAKEYYFNAVDFVSYESHLFNDTIRNNFKLVNPYVTEREIAEALKKVKLYDYIRQNGGLDQQITLNGAKFSGGQKQRLIIAFHLTLNRFIRIFDEATSNIDAESEQIIVDILEQLAQTNIIIFVTHRINNLVNAKNIYVLANKEIAEQGSHNTLLTLNGEYKKLYDELNKYKGGGN